MPRKDTPCSTCPKYALWKDSAYPYLGLHPKNLIYVTMYYLACGETRVGTMDGAYLLRTLNPERAIHVLNLYADYFPTIKHMQWAYETLWEIDRIVTDVRSTEENQKRKIAQQTMENKQRSQQARRR